MVSQVSQQKDLWNRLAAIADPELPMITIGELGVLRDVVCEKGQARVMVTPTYSGCPAMDAIRSDIEKIASELGWEVEVETAYSPAWTTDWLSEEAKDKLRRHGIAPPVRGSGDQKFALAACPRCEAKEAKTVSRFGSTACKALMVCLECREPFDYFKAH